MQSAGPQAYSSPAISLSDCQSRMIMLSMPPSCHFPQFYRDKAVKMFLSLPEIDSGLTLIVLENQEEKKTKKH